jgi:hypothetical protein
MEVQRLITAGRELIKGDFNTALKSLTPDSFDIVPQSYRPSIAPNDNWFFEANGKSVFHFKYSGHNSAVRAYEICPPVNAIINRKAQAYINGKTWVLNLDGKQAGKVATTVEAKKLQALFEKPNPLQSWKQFEAQGYIYQQLFGYTIVLPIKPVGFKDNIDATALWNIPPSMVDIEETNKLFYQSDTKGIIKQIVLNYKGTQSILNVEDIYILKDFTPSFRSLVLPDSRIHALELPINNIIGAYESRNVLINYRGALGILSQDPGNGNYGSLPMGDDHKLQLQQDLRRYGLKNHQWQFIITSASLKWQQMGIATKDLMLFEEIEAGIQAICDSYNYPYQLLSSAKGTTFSNLNEGKKLLYQDATLPESESIYEQWNQLFNTKKYNLKIDKDYSHVAVLQEDKQQSAQARKTLNEALTIEFQNGLITLDGWLERLGEDPLPDGLGQVRATDPKKSNVPLAVIIGVGGVQGLIAVITAQGMSDEAKQATLEVVFGLSTQDAARMSAQSQQTNTDETGNETGQQGQAAA